MSYMRDVLSEPKKSGFKGISNRMETHMLVNFKNGTIETRKSQTHVPALPDDPNSWDGFEHKAHSKWNGQTATFWSLATARFWLEAINDTYEARNRRMGSVAA